jgi:hypothetical protein
MDNLKMVLIILVLLLGVGTFYFYVQSASVKAQLDQAREANRLTIELLRLEGTTCNAQASDFRKVQSCIQPLLIQKDFKEDGFAQPDDRRGYGGYLVIKNVNHRAYDSDSFLFLYDRQLSQQGCSLRGEIGYGITCRFNFTQHCERGSVLEVNYTNETSSYKVFTKTC